MSFFKRLWCSGGKRAEAPPLVYSQADADGICDYIEESFGKVGYVVHELVSPEIHVDIALLPPSPERPFYTLSTMGAGAYEMNVPERLVSSGLERAEYMIHLPAGWKVDDADETWYWPLKWLKILSRFPLEENTWLCASHTIPAGEPFAGNTNLCCILLLNATVEQKDERAEAIYEMQDGSPVHFYRMIPLYEEEMNFKVENGTEALLSLLGEDVIYGPLDVNRRNYCT